MGEGSDYSIVELEKSDWPAFCACLTPEDATVQEAPAMKERWLETRTHENFGAKLARLSNGAPAGMIQYLPIEESSAEGHDLWFIYCIWIPPKRRHPAGQQRARGIGKALLRAAEEDVRSRGAKGIAAWGGTLPLFMQSKWFKKCGYQACDRQGIMELVWKPFADDAVAPNWARTEEREFSPDTAARPGGTVSVAAYISGICPAMNAVYHRFARAAEEIGDAVRLETIDMTEPGPDGPRRQIDAVFVNGEEFPMGPPPSYRKIKAALRKAAKAR